MNFAQAFKIISTSKTKLDKQFSEIPDIVITSDNEDLLMRTQGSKIDPMSVRFIASWLNPIYYFRMRVAEWQVNRYNAAKEELKIIQLRKLHLERMRSGEADARLEKEISYLEERAQKLNYNIQQMEESHSRN